MSECVRSYLARMPGHYIPRTAEPTAPYQYWHRWPRLTTKAHIAHFHVLSGGTRRGRATPASLWGAHGGAVLQCCTCSRLEALHQRSWPKSVTSPRSCFVVLRAGQVDVVQEAKTSAFQGFWARP